VKGQLGLNTRVLSVSLTANLLPALAFGDERTKKRVDPSSCLRDLVDALGTERMDITDSLEVLEKRGG